MKTSLPMNAIDSQLPEGSDFTRQTEYIVGGSNASRNEYGEFVLILITDGVSEIIGDCGGTLIASNKVLTAAHCAQGAAFQYFVIPNFYSFNDPVTAADLIAVTRVASHPMFTASPALDYDLAVLTLASNVFSPQAKVHKGNAEFVGDVGTVIGVGLTGTDPVTSVPVLQEVNAPIVENSDCNDTWEELSGERIVSSREMCAGFDTDDRGSCFGDSGGPLWNDIRGERVLVGTVSFGFGRCELNRANQGYARVSSMTDFIKSESPATQFVTSSDIYPIGAIKLLLDE